jgi:hypothetical protein
MLAKRQRDGAGARVTAKIAVPAKFVEGVVRALKLASSPLRGRKGTLLS